MNMLPRTWQKLVFQTPRASLPRCSNTSLKFLRAQHVSAFKSPVADQIAAIHPLSPLDHLMGRRYISKLLYFASNSDPAATVATLRSALGRTIAAIPVLAGSVAPIPQKGQKGALSVQKPYHSVDDLFSVKDLRDEYAYDELRSKQFPTDAIPTDLISPPLAGKNAHVMLAQVNLLRGGLLLYVRTNHCVMDGVGSSNLLKVWSSYCRGEDGSKLVQPEWMDQCPLMQQGAGAGDVQDYPEYRLAPNLEVAVRPEAAAEYISDSPTVETAIFFFSDASLRLLKSAASHRRVNVIENTQEATASISTNDALCALLWCGITSARQRESTSLASNMPAVFCMAVNGRNRLSPPVPADYGGNVVFISKAYTSPHVLLASNPDRLPVSAALIRKSNLVIDDAYIRDVIKMVHNTPDLDTLAPPPFSSAKHIVAGSSWASQSYYQLGWGDEVGGTCERIRCRSVRADGFYFILPRIPSIRASGDDSGGGLEVVLGLEREHLQRLREDKTFNRFAQWRAS